MVKHTQTICQEHRQIVLNVFDHFVGFVIKGLIFQPYIATQKAILTFSVNGWVFSFDVLLLLNNKT